MLVVLLAAVGVNVFYGWQVVNGGGAKKFFYDSDVNRHTGCDFFGLYKAGHALTRGQNIYAGDDAHQVVPCCYAFRYLPIGATLGAALTKLPPREAYLAWLVLLELLALLCAWWTYRSVGGVAGALLGGLWLAAAPLYLELYMGQFNLLQAALLLGALAATAKNSTPVGEGFLGVAMLWKLTGWLGAPVLVLRRRWRTLLLVAALALASSAAYVALTGHSLAPFFDNFRPASAKAAIYRGDQGVLMLLRVLLGAKLPAAVVYGLPLGAMALALLVTVKGERGATGDLFAVWFAAYFFIFPTIWEHHYLMLLPVLAHVYARGRYRVLWIAAALLALPTVYYWAGPHGAHWHGVWPILHHAQRPLAALIVLAAACYHAWRRG